MMLTRDRVPVNNWSNSNAFQTVVLETILGYTKSVKSSAEKM